MIFVALTQCRMDKISSSVSPVKKGQFRRTGILPQAYVGADAHLGVGCIVNAGAIVDHNAQLGRGVHVAPGGICLLYTSRCV